MDRWFSSVLGARALPLLKPRTGDHARIHFGQISLVARQAIVLHDSPRLETRCTPHQVRPALVVGPISVGLLHVQIDFVSGGRLLVHSVSVQGHGHDGGFKRVARTVLFGADDSADQAVGHRLAHDEQIGQAGPIGVGHAGVGDAEFQRAIEQIVPFFLALFPFFGPVVLAQVGQIGLESIVRSHEPSHAFFAGLEVEDQHHAIIAGRESVGLERVGVGAGAKDQHPVGSLAVTGDEVIAHVLRGIHPGGILPPRVSRVAADEELVRLRIRIDHFNADQGCRRAADCLQPHRAVGVFIKVIQRRQERIEPRPTAFAERMAVDLRRDHENTTQCRR